MSSAPQIANRTAGDGRDVPALAARTQEFVHEVVMPAEERFDGDVDARRWATGCGWSCRRRRARRASWRPHAPRRVRRARAGHGPTGRRCSRPRAARCSGRWRSTSRPRTRETSTCSAHVATAGPAGAVPRPAGPRGGAVGLRDDRAGTRGGLGPGRPVDDGDRGCPAAGDQRAQVVHHRRRRRRLLHHHGAHQRRSRRARRRARCSSPRPTSPASRWGGTSHAGPVDARRALRGRLRRRVRAR